MAGLATWCSSWLSAHRLQGLQEKGGNPWSRAGALPQLAKPHNGNGAPMGSSPRAFPSKAPRAAGAGTELPTAPAPARPAWLPAPGDPGLTFGPKVCRGRAPGGWGPPAPHSAWTSRAAPLGAGCPFRSCSLLLRRSLPPCSPPNSGRAVRCIYIYFLKDCFCPYPKLRDTVTPKRWMHHPSPVPA